MTTEDSVGIGSSRVRNLTEKGKNYHLQILEDQRSSAQRSWRKQLNRVIIVIADTTNQNLIMSERTFLEAKMEILSAANEKLYDFLEGNYDAKKEALMKFESIDREHSDALRKVNERICELKQETGSERSRISRRSSQDSHSRKSNGSSTASSLAKRNAIAANVARLKTELEFADAEAQKTRALKEQEDELKRFKLTKELAVAKAEMEALIENEGDEVVAKESLPDEIDTNYVLQNYLKTQASSVTNVDNLTVETNVESVDRHLEENPSNNGIPVVKNEPVATPSKITPAEETISLPKQEPGIPTPKSLNPFAPEFEASPFPRYDPYYTADYEPYKHQEAKTSDSTRKSTVEDPLTRLADILSQRRLQDTLPLPEPEIFSGDLLHYPVWLKSFETIIEGQTEKVSQRLYYLGKYTTGKPKEAISGLLLLETEDAYKQARKILSDRFGNPFLVADAYRKKINEWPKIPPNDGTSLRKFSDFLIHCQTATNTMKYLKVLDDPDENRRMVRKLPRYLIDRWSREVDRWLNKDDDLRHSEETSSDVRKGEMDYPPFSVFCRFLQRESRIACNPVTTVRPQKEEVAKENSDKGRKLNGFNRRKPPSFNALATESHEVTDSNINGRKEKKSEATSCPLCKASHDLDVCKQFLKKSVAERRDFIKANALCLGCLKWGHMKRTCRRRLVCKTCNGFHPTSLHSDPAPNENEQDSGSRDTPIATSHRVNLSDMKNMKPSCMHSLIVPVWIHHRRDIRKKLLTYALLDEQSDACFVKEDLLERLNVNGPEVELKLSTVLTEEVIKSRRIEGLVVRGYNEDVEIPLPKSYSRSSIPAKKSQIPRPESALNWPHLQKISEIMPLNEDIEVGLLIGLNCPRAIKPLEVIPGKEDDPYAKKTALGWGIIGAVRSSNEEDTEVKSEIACNRIITREVQGTPKGKMCHFAFKTQVKEMISPSDVSKMFTLDFNERQTDEKPLSVEDRRFLRTVREGIHQLPDGHFEMPLPLRHENLELPNSKRLALNRLLKLRGRLLSEDQFRKDYCSFMEDIISSGYAERVPVEETSTTSKQVWYIPHHGVYHKKKPGKIRVVFDCSALCDGQSLNQQLLQGPDLTNNLTGVLCRFRQERIAFMCDIQGMFHQVKVNKEHRNLLRFLWWDNPELKGDPVEFRMTVHLFGATSSPGCANFALRTAADQYEETCGSAAAHFIRRNFYVDDGLKSVPSVEHAKELIKSTKSLCQKGGFRLHKFTSNSREEDRAVDAKDHLLVGNDTAVERALGVHWCIESDTLQFRIIMQYKPLSRRGILSTVSSVFDPLGLVSPFILVGKQILQELCRDGVAWDDEVPDKLRPKWEKWRTELPALERLRVARCHKPQDFDEVKNVELHQFSDACQNGYGQCSYIRLVDVKNRVHCSLVMGKSRVTPLKPVTIPRLELTAAVVSSKISCMLRKELEYAQMKEVFWTDSKTVLGYINNDARRFHVFVGNHVQEIREWTSPNQWHYVGTKSNPADIASRGIGAQELIDNTSWWNGPDFLWNSPKDWDSVDDTPPIPPDDPEVRNISVRATQIQEPKLSSLLERLTYFSNWHRLGKAIAACLRLQERFRKTTAGEQRERRKEGIGTYKPVDVKERQHAELQIIRIVQNEAFQDEIQSLKDVNIKSPAADKDASKERMKTVKESSSLYKLDPFLDKDGVLRVGGRLRQSSIPYDVKHPVILSKKGHVTDLILCHFHQLIKHQGRGITQNEIRSSGYWIVGGSSVVSKHISECVSCRKLRGRPQEQKMANLPEDRLEPAPPFTFCAVDYFGPWYIKEGRREVKRYGVLFTCLASRAVHVEVASSLSTDSFLNAYRRFVGRRGPVRQLRSDQGTNFVGAKNELQQALSTLHHEKIQQELAKRNCDWIDFKMNVPEASHMGGAWERQIRTVRNVLSTLLTQHAAQLDDETLKTFMVEAEAIVNCRPLTVDTINSPQMPEPLTPNHLLTMKSKVILPPPGEFQRADLYSKKRWRRVQYLANEFWTRWRKDYLQSLQPRQKWMAKRRNLQVDDIVVVMDDNSPRNSWRIARVEEGYPDDDGLVRKVPIKIADRNLDRNGQPVGPPVSLCRPVQKLILLLPHEEREDRGIPT